MMMLLQTNTLYVFIFIYQIPDSAKALGGSVHSVIFLARYFLHRNNMSC